MPLPPVPHNLEPQDKIITDWVVDELSLGSRPDFTIRELDNNEAAVISYNNRTNQNVIIPNEIRGRTVVGIDAGAFCYNDPVSVSIPSTVRYVGAGAFCDCPELTAVYFASNSALTEIGAGAFTGCPQLTSISLPDSVTDIGSFAFCGCGMTGTLNLPASLASLGAGAFKGCPDMTGFAISPTNTAFTTAAGVLYDSTAETLLAYPTGKTDSVFTAPSSVLTVADLAFAGNTHIASVILPKPGSFMIA